MVSMTQEDLDTLGALVKKLHPETRNGFYGRVNIELDFKDSVIGNQPYIEIRCSHLVRVSK